MTDFGMARDVQQDEIYTKTSRVGIKLGIFKLSGIDTLIKRQMSSLIYKVLLFVYDHPRQANVVVIPDKRIYQLQQETNAQILKQSNYQKIKNNSSLLYRWVSNS